MVPGSPRPPKSHDLNPIELVDLFRSCPSDCRGPSSRLLLPWRSTGRRWRLRSARSSLIGCVMWCRRLLTGMANGLRRSSERTLFWQVLTIATLCWRIEKSGILLERLYLFFFGLRSLIYIFYKYFVCVFLQFEIIEWYSFCFCFGDEILGIFNKILRCRSLNLFISLHFYLNVSHMRSLIIKLPVCY